jgi:hypothetical protein
MAHYRYFSPVLFFLLLIFSSAVIQAQTLKENTGLFDKPDGAKTADAKAGTPLKITKRQGFWVEVDAGGKKGWVKLGVVNMASTTGGSVALDTGRTGKGNIVSTSAARGLSAKDLLQGKPDPQAVVKLESYVLDASVVPSFRTEGGIHPLTEKIALTAPPAEPAAKSEAKPEEKKATEATADEDYDTPKKKKRKDDW